MAALASVWLGFVTLIVSLTMLFWRPAFTDITVPFVLWLGSPGTMCIAGLVLWSSRKEKDHDEGMAAQRLQCKVAIFLAIAAAAVVYYLIINADQVLPGLLESAPSL